MAEEKGQKTRAKKRPCSVAGCEKNEYAWRLCLAHYRRRLRGKASKAAVRPYERRASEAAMQSYLDPNVEPVVLHTPEVRAHYVDPGTVREADLAPWGGWGPNPHVQRPRSEPASYLSTPGLMDKTPNAPSGSGTSHGHDDEGLPASPTPGAPPASATSGAPPASVAGSWTVVPPASVSSTSGPASQPALLGAQPQPALLGPGSAPSPAGGSPAATLAPAGSLPPTGDAQTPAAPFPPVSAPAPQPAVDAGTQSAAPSSRRGLQHMHAMLSHQLAQTDDEAGRQIIQERLDALAQQLAQAPSESDGGTDDALPEESAPVTPANTDDMTASEWARQMDPGLYARGQKVLARLRPAQAALGEELGPALGEAAESAPLL